MASSDLFVFSVGPVETRQGAGLVFLGLWDGQLIGPTRTHDPRAALAELAAQVPLGTPWTCAPDLEVAAAGAGFRCTRPSEAALEIRALVSVALAHVSRAPRDLEVLGTLVRAAARFWAARPWERLPADVALAVEARGPVEKDYECSVMGAAGEQFGVVLYPEPGSVDRVVRAVNQGRMDLYRRIEQFSLSFDEEPSYARRAVEAWCGLPWFPIAFAVHRGKAQGVTAHEALLLAATLDAMAGMTGRPGEVGTGRAGEGEAEVRASVHVPGQAPRRGRARSRGSVSR